MRDRLRLPRVLRKRKRRKRKRMRRRRRRRSKSKFSHFSSLITHPHPDFLGGQIVRQEEPPIHLRNCSLSQLLHKTTAVDSCCTLQKQTLRPSREIFQLKFTNVSNLCSWDILRLVNKQIIFPFVRFDFTQSPYLKGCFPKLNKDGKLCIKTIAPILYISLVSACWKYHSRFDSPPSPWVEQYLDKLLP